MASVNSTRLRQYLRTHGPSTSVEIGRYFGVSSTKVCAHFSWDVKRGVVQRLHPEVGGLTIYQLAPKQELWKLPAIWNAVRLLCSIGLVVTEPLDPGAAGDAGDLPNTGEQRGGKTNE